MTRPLLPLRGIQQRVLAAVGGASPGWARLADLEASLGYTPAQVKDALGRLKEKGLVRRPHPGAAQIRPAGKLLLGDGRCLNRGAQGPRPMGGDSFRVRLWRALRIRVRATLFELLQLAARGDEADARANATRYLGALGRAGFVADRRVPGQAAMEVPYVLLRNTGPLAPQWNKRQRRVFDPNTGEVHRVA